MFQEVFGLKDEDKTKKQLIDELRGMRQPITELVASEAERKQAEEEIRLLLTMTQAISESQDFYVALEIAIRKVCETTGWSFGEAWVPSHDGKVLECSPAWYSSTNSLQKFRKLSKESTFSPNVGLPGRVWLSKKPEWIPDVSTEPETAFLRAQIALESGLKAGFGVPIIASGQVLAVLAFFMFEPREEDKRLVEMVSVVATQLGSVTQRKRAEEQIKQLQEYLQLQISRMPIALIVWDREFRVQSWNPAAEKIFGFTTEEALEKHPYDFIVPKETQPQVDTIWHRLLKGDMTAYNINENITKDGRTIICDWANTPLRNADGTVAGVLSMVQDITERKKMQAQLMISDRLASIGELVSGVAHELNNPMTGIIGFSHLLLAQDLSDDVRKDLEIINKEAKRTAQIVKGLLTFARKQKTEKESVDINKVIQAVLDLRAYEQKLNNIEVNTHLPADLPEIIANGSQLQQVFLNLVVNAEQAMLEAHNKGILTITSEQVGDMVKLSFTDDGPGIPQQNLGHLFDPFFTTKGEGKGTGLGLSISYGIITEHGGLINAENNDNGGATFVIQLPIYSRT